MKLEKSSASSLASDGFRQRDNYDEKLGIVERGVFT